MPLRRELDVDALGDRRGTTCAASPSGSTTTIGRAVVAALAQLGHERDLAEQRHVELVGQLLRRRRSPNSS